MTKTLAISGGLQQYLAEVEKYPLLTPAKERELADLYYDKGDLAAAHSLVTANLRFVIKVAHEYRSYGMRMLDLVQEGNIGLMMAVKKFNPHRGYRLITYAVHWIRAYIQKYILQTWSLVKIGTTQAQRKLFYKLNQTTNALKGGRADAESEIGMTDALASALDVKDKDVVEMQMRMSGRDFSLDNTVDIEGGASYVDRLESKTQNQEDELIETEEIVLREEGVHKALATLSDRENYVVNHRILAEKPSTLQEVGDHLKISRERVRQIEVGALKKLKGELWQASSN